MAISKTKNDIERQVPDLTKKRDRPAPSPDETARTFDGGSESHDHENMRNERAELHRITDINAYKGSTLGEKIDTIIRSHPVVMIDRTWCLFSVDAQNFLLHQMRVSVHSIEVDVHPQGQEIFKYVKEKTKHYTTPVIFIRGEFLGGFKEVNALYAKGMLEKHYLKDLSQADQCDAVLAGTQYKTTPFFWFPEKVDGNVIRITGVLCCFASGICAFLVHYLFWARYITYVIAIDFVFRLIGGAKFSLFGSIAMLAAYHLEPVPRTGRPKQFAQCCGILLSGLASLFFSIPFPGHDIVGSIFLIILACCCGMEGFLDFCVGCVVFRLLVKFGLFRGTSAS